MRSRFILATFLLLTGCASAPVEIRRLSPVPQPSRVPSQCKIISLMKDSPAQKAGLSVGDFVKTVNGVVPADAGAMPELVNKSGPDMDLEIVSASGAARHVTVHLNATRPRLGAVCDLTGMRKPGVTSAGNESETTFDGPFAFTASGILDKGIVFMRVRLTNDSDHALTIAPSIFSAADANQAPMKVLSPLEVMCYLYGDKGAHLLALKKKHKETLDTDVSPTADKPPEAACSGFAATGHLSGANAEYVEANAIYVAEESLWPDTYAAGKTADGLIYMLETASLPITVKASVEGRVLASQFALPKAGTGMMKADDLVHFFEAQPKGVPLRMTLKKGRVFVGRFASYDSIEERVWFDTPHGGMLNSTSFPLISIQSVETIEQVPAKPEPVSPTVN